MDNDEMEPGGDAVKAGARHSAKDRTLLKAIHDGAHSIIDAAVELGADAEDAREAVEDAAKTLIYAGGEVKALPGGRLGGYLVRFSSAAEPDLMGDYFTQDTDFDLTEDGKTTAVLYQHGFDPTIGKRKIGQGIIHKDELGVWIEAQLALRDEYEWAIQKLAEMGKLGWSSGTASHRITKISEGGAKRILTWPLGLDASLSPIPAEPRTEAIALKAWLESGATPELKALIPQADVRKASATDGAATAAEPVDKITTEVAMSEELTALTAEVAALKGVIEKLAAEPAQTKAGFLPAEAKDPNDTGPFKSLGEQLLAVRASALPGARIDERLYQVKAPLGANVGVTSEGGFLLQQGFAPGLWQRTYEQGAVLPRCTAFPLGDNQDSVAINQVDETSRADGSRWGGIRQYWVAEAGTITASAPTFKRLVLAPKKEGVIFYATSEMLRGATTLEAYVNQVVPQELMFGAEYAIFNGDGSGKPLGLAAAPAQITVAKETGQAADTVVWENIVKMWARLDARSKARAAWYVSQDVPAQLYQMSMSVGTGGMPVYLPGNGAAGSPFGTLLGRPVIETEYCDKLGDENDIWLVDLSQYGVCTRGGVQSGANIYLQWLTDQTCFRFLFEIDGGPLWNSALTPINGGATTSPYVNLAERA